MATEYLENSTTRFYPGDIVTIDLYDDVKWILHNGWYLSGVSAENGWYFTSISDKSVIPLSIVDIEGVYRVADTSEPVYRPTLIDECTTNNNVQVSDELNLNPGDIVTLSDFPEYKFIYNYGWYSTSSTSKYGANFKSISDGLIVELTSIDISTITKVVEESPEIEYRQSIETPTNDNAQPTSSQYIVIPNTNIRLYNEDIVELKDTPNTRFIVYNGWYTYNNCQQYGWYLLSLSDNTIYPVEIIDLSLYQLESVHSHGYSAHAGPKVNYTRPFTESDYEFLNRTFISVSTLSQRDNLDPKILTDGRLVRVNDVDGVALYYTYHSDTSTWEMVDFSGGGIIHNIPAATDDGEVYIAVVDTQGVLRYVPTAIIDILNGTSKIDTPVDRVGHKLNIGTYHYDGSEEVTVPVYDGSVSDTYSSINTTSLYSVYSNPEYDDCSTQQCTLISEDLDSTLQCVSNSTMKEVSEYHTSNTILINNR